MLVCFCQVHQLKISKGSFKSSLRELVHSARLKTPKIHRRSLRIFERQKGRNAKGKKAEGGGASRRSILAFCLSAFCLSKRAVSEGLRFAFPLLRRSVAVAAIQSGWQRRSSPGRQAKIFCGCLGRKKILRPGRQADSRILPHETAARRGRRGKACL